MIYTIIIHALFIVFATRFLDKNKQWLQLGSHIFKTIFAITLVVLWMLASITLCTWMWAGLFIILDIFSSLEPAIYFSLVTMTTLGYGDIILEPQWRILSSLTAVNGLLLFGLTTAFLVEFIFQIRKSQQ